MSHYIPPEIDLYSQIEEMLSCNHLLIAGASGSGKSVLEHSLIYQILGRCPLDMPTNPDDTNYCAQLILLDPKMVELSRYKDLPHTIRYATSTSDILDALRFAERVMLDRFKQMDRDGKDDAKYRYGHIYVIIDELGDLMTTCKKEAAPLIQRIAQLGRAARVHIIACTQCPTTAVIPTTIKVNFDGMIGLRTRSAQDSRNIIGESGCELLPNPQRAGRGECLFLHGADLQKYIVPMVSRELQNEVIAHWMEQEAAQDAMNKKESIFSRLFTFLKGSHAA